MDTSEQQYEVIVIGGGAAGLTAGLFVARQGYSVLLISKEFGGQTFTTDEIENYPGIGRITGPALMQAFVYQAREAGVTMEHAMVQSIHKEESGHAVTTPKGEFHCRALIVAHGKSPRHLGVEREAEFFNDIAYGVPHDTVLLKGKNIAVVGGANSAMQAIIALNGIAKNIYGIVRAENYRGEAPLLKKIAQCTNFTPHFSSTLTAFTGEPRQLEGIAIVNTDGTETSLDVDYIIGAMGLETNVTFLSDLVALDDKKQVIIDNQCQTSAEGIFACGDATTSPYKQIVISAGEGAKAGLTAARYIAAKEGTPMVIDWGYRG